MEEKVHIPEELTEQQIKDNELFNAICADVSFGMSIDDAQAANGVGTTWVREYLKKNPALRKQMKESQEMRKEYRVTKVEDSLYKRAVGFKAKETRKEIMPNSQGKPTVVRQTTTEKEIAPDTQAAIFWLTNEKKDKWKNRNQTDVNAEVKHSECKIVVSNAQQEAALNASLGLIDEEPETE